MKFCILLILLINFPFVAWAAAESKVPLEQPKINFKDKASLQRGAKLYINYCLGCHSMTYLRYNGMAKGTGIVKPDGEIAANLVKDNLIFSDAKITDAIKSAMPETFAKTWFGVAPPDLTLVARVRGVDWLYTYLKSFYVDDSRPFGVNNLVFPDVGMPHVLESLQGRQIPIYNTTEKVVDGQLKTVKEVAHLAVESPGSMSEAEFSRAMNDLVNFLAYAGTPEKIKRHYIGYWVIGFLVIFSVLAYLLKREYWRDVKKNSH